MAASNKKPPIALQDKDTMGKSPVTVRWKGSRPLIVDAIQVSYLKTQCSAICFVLYQDISLFGNLVIVGNYNSIFYRVC